MNNAEAVNWLINITADIGKVEHQDLWHYEQALSEIREMLEDAPSVEPQRWIPFETMEPDAEEKEDHPEWDFVLCGKLPQDGQRILVNIKYKGHEAVQMDEYYDDGGECYLDSGYDIATEATAWMPLPEPYVRSDMLKGKQDDRYD